MSHHKYTTNVYQLLVHREYFERQSTRTSAGDGERGDYRKIVGVSVLASATFKACEFEETRRERRESTLDFLVCPFPFEFSAQLARAGGRSSRSLGRQSAPDAGACTQMRRLYQYSRGRKRRAFFAQMCSNFLPVIFAGPELTRGTRLPDACLGAFGHSTRDEVKKKMYFRESESNVEPL